MIKSPLRYPGGKSRAVRNIASLVPDDFKEYREPFVGGGSVFVHLCQQFPDARYWINDLHPSLIAFWLAVQQDVNALVQQVKSWRAEYAHNGKDLYRFLTKKIPELDTTQQGAAFFVLNRITFSGTTESGGFSKQAFSGRFTDSSIERVVRLAPLLDNITITNHDYQVLLNQPGEDVFLFLDPPYYSATNSALYGKNGHLHRTFDHQRLADALQKCPHRWLITYDDSSYIRELYRFATIIPWNLTYGMRNVNKGRSQRGKEVFIKNY